MSSTLIDYEGRTLTQLAELAEQGDKVANFWLAKKLNIPGAKAPRLGQISIPHGKGHVRMYVSDKGAIHFQGAPGTSAQYGATLYWDFLEWLFANEEKIMDFQLENGTRLSEKCQKCKKPHVPGDCN